MSSISGSNSKKVNELTVKTLIKCLKDYAEAETGKFIGPDGKVRQVSTISLLAFTESIKKSRGFSDLDEEIQKLFGDAAFKAWATAQNKEVAEYQKKREFAQLRQYQIEAAQKARQDAANSQPEQQPVEEQPATPVAVSIQILPEPEIAVVQEVEVFAQPELAVVQEPVIEAPAQQQESVEQPIQEEAVLTQKIEREDFAVKQKQAFAPVLEELVKKSQAKSVQEKVVEQPALIIADSESEYETASEVEQFVDSQSEASSESEVEYAGTLSPTVAKEASDEELAEVDGYDADSETSETDNDALIPVEDGNKKAQVAQNKCTSKTVLGTCFSVMSAAVGLVVKYSPPIVQPIQTFIRDAQRTCETSFARLSKETDILEGTVTYHVQDLCLKQSLLSQTCSNNPYGMSGCSIGDIPEALSHARDFAIERPMAIVAASTLFIALSYASKLLYVKYKNRGVVAQPQQLITPPVTTVPSVEDEESDYGMGRLFDTTEDRLLENRVR